MEMEMAIMRDVDDDDEEEMVDIDGEDLPLPLLAAGAGCGGWLGAQEALATATLPSKEGDEVSDADQGRAAEEENREEEEEEDCVLDCSFNRIEDDNHSTELQGDKVKERYTDGREEDEAEDKQGVNRTIMVRDSGCMIPMTSADPIKLISSCLSPEPEVECSVPDRIRKRPMSSILKVLPTLTRSKGHLTIPSDEDPTSFADVVADPEAQCWGLDARLGSHELEEEEMENDENGKAEDEEDEEKEDEENRRGKDEEEDEEIGKKTKKGNENARSSSFSIDEILKPEFGVVRQQQQPPQPHPRMVDSTRLMTDERLIGDCILGGMMLQRRHLQQQQEERRPGRSSNLVCPSHNSHQSSPLLHPYCTGSSLIVDRYSASAAAAAAAAGVIHPLYLSSARERVIPGAQEHRKFSATARSTALRLQGLLNNNNNNNNSSNNSIDNSNNSMAYCFDDRMREGLDCIGESVPPKHPLQGPKHFPLQGPKHPLDCRRPNSELSKHSQKPGEALQRRNKHPTKSRVSTARTQPSLPLLEANAPARYIGRGTGVVQVHPLKQHPSGISQPIQAELTKDSSSVSDRSCVSTPSSTVGDGVLCNHESSSSSSSSSSSLASSSAAENSARRRSGASGGATSGGRSDEPPSSMPWPAWVYCTRYSDRPSSGPRCRKNKKKERSPDEKRPRTAFTNDQLGRLKREFDDNKYLTEERRQALARELALNESQIKIWFQNKRAKMKKASGVRNSLALQLMAQGLYNHSSVTVMSR